MIKKIGELRTEYISIISPERKYVYVSSSYLRHMKLKTEDIIGKSPEEIWKDQISYKKINSSLEKSLKGEVISYKSKFAFGDKKGIYRVKYTPIYNSIGKIENILVSTIDVTNEETIIKQTIRKLLFDNLTNAYNRNSFTEDIKEIYSKGDPFFLMMIDLDNFKRVNDVFGHLTGDKVLIEVTNKIKQIIKKSTKIYRIGGDEFALLGNLREEANYKNSQKLGEKILDSVANSEINEKYKVTTSIGLINIINKEKIDIKSLIELADNNLYSSKRSGKSTIKVTEII